METSKVIDFQQRKASKKWFDGFGYAVRQGWFEPIYKRGELIGVNITDNAETALAQWARNSVCTEYKVMLHAINEDSKIDTFNMLMKVSMAATG